MGLTRAVGSGLAALVGRDGATDDPAACVAVAVDGRAPRWLLRPADLEQAAAVLALAHAEGLAVAPRGRGTAQELGAPPARLDVVLDLGRLDAILEYNPDDLTVTVQAGATAGALAETLAARRQTLPVDPPGWSGRTLGGIAATAASGPLRARYGTIRDLLLGARFVQADGVVTWGGARVVKSVTGYDVPKLLIGSLGTLGVLGELTLRLHPLPESEATCLAGLRTAEAARDLVAAIVDSTLQPSRVELLDARALAACGLPEAAVGVVVSIGSVEGAVRAQQAAVTELAARLRGRVETMGPAFWRHYDRVLAGSGRTVLRVATLPTRLAAALAEAHAALAAATGRLVTGCAPFGLLRVAVGDVEPAVIVNAVERLRAFVAEDEGSVIVERAPRPVREALDPWGPVAPGPLALMRALKQEFDPTGVLNPGRFAGGI